MNAPAYHLTQFAVDVRRGLDRPGQKEVPASYLYDELGSALFEAITLLPEYGLTRADQRLLRTYAGAIAANVAAGSMVAELGSGTGTKTRSILEAVGRKGAVEYFPIDVSAAALRGCSAELESVARVHPVNATYVDGLRRITRLRRPGQSMLLLFLGSTIGNFDRTSGLEFLRTVRSLLLEGDALLIGADLVKPLQDLILAYDDPAGVTAAFNKNVLGRMNRELSADFNLRNFAHEARWNAAHSRIEMHLRATVAHAVHIPGSECTVDFEQHETIWTESSHKFEADELDFMATATGFTPEATWVDPEWHFAECFWRV